VPEPLRGLGVSPGVAVGPVASMGGRVPEPPAAPGDPASRPARRGAGEAAAAEAALAAVAADLEARGERAGGDAADVLQAQAMMALDPGLAEKVEHATAEGRTAARAVFEAFASYREELAEASEYLAARVADLDDVRDRAVARLLGVPMPGVPDPGHPFVLVARDLAPADTATLDKQTVLAFVTEEGGPTSHTAILARSLGVPAVVGCAGVTALADGTRVLVDGGSGEVVADPAEAATAAALRRAAARRSALAGAPSGPGATADGRRVLLLANVRGPAEVPDALAAGAEGVGLFRTEFLFLDRTQPPTVDEQEIAYRQVLDAFPAGAKVVIRTLDAGADKPLAFLTPRDEPNPALGQRGLRAVRLSPEILTDQLDAVGRAAKASRAAAWVMAPMVATAAEAAWFRDQAHRQQVATAGVMVEVPAAALLAEAVLAEADFASIGTNDLAQYTYAADRQLGGLAAFQDPWQPALLALVARVGEAGRSLGKPVGVCGEAAGDPLLALVLTGLGMTSLSMAPAALAAVRLLLARHTLEDCRRLAAIALAAGDAETARARVREVAPAAGELGL
jgi:phosphoenolpyruvate-protein phosphotransferase (PTS system enzyme I)